MIYLLKLLDLKRYLIFLFIFCTLSFTIICFNESKCGTDYTLHNLTIKYSQICYKKNLYYLNNKEIKLLKKNNIYCPPNISSSNYIVDKILRKILLKYVFMNAPLFLNISTSEFLNNNGTYIIFPDFNSSEYFQQVKDNKQFYPLYLKNTKLLNKELRYKLLSLLFTGTFDFDYGFIKKVLIHPIIAFSLLVIILFVGIITKNYFYILFVGCWFSILVVLFITMPFKYYLYIYPFTLCTYCIFMTLIAGLCKHIFIKH